MSRPSADGLFAMAMDPLQAEQTALKQLDSGERLLWCGSPAPWSLAFTALPVALFGVAFASFAAFWIWGAAHATSGEGGPGGPWALFPLFGLPFLLIGLAMVSTPLWAYLGAQKTVYAVTDKRAIIVSGIAVGPGARGVQSFTSEDIGEIARVERPDGFGAVHFASRTHTTSKGYERTTRIGFVGIPEVRRVEQLIRENLQGSAAA